MTTTAVHDAPLRHIIVVGGAQTQWTEMSEQQWADRLDELGKVADHVGAQWLTMRPYSGDDSARGLEHSAEIGTCRVTAQPVADGRVRVAEAASTLQRAGTPITEAALAEQLNLPALADPDLVVVLGPGHRLPPSLVWELAYAELVFVDTDWTHLGAAHLDEAISTYARRHRRFGGID